MHDSPTGPYEIEVYFDGGCPLCVREMALVRWLDRRHAIRFTDIDSPSFLPEWTGKSYEQFMARMLGRLPDGTWVDGVEVFRRIYAAVGFVRLAALSRLPLESSILDFSYSVFAMNRLRLTGRCLAKSCSTKRPDLPHS